MTTIAIIFTLLGIYALVYGLKKQNPFLNFLGCFLIMMSTIIIGDELKPKKMIIDLPEEINIAKENDTLYIVRKTKDTIYIGFRNYKNK